MDIRKAFDVSRKNSVIDIDFGNVFIDTAPNPDQDEYRKRLSWINHFDTYSNWYLPFSRCSHYVSSKDRNKDGMSRCVTFIDNPEHKITSPISFIAMLDVLGVLEGHFELKVAEEYTRDDAVAYQKANPDCFVVIGKPSMSEEDGEPKFIALFTLKNFHLYDPVHKVKRSVSLNIDHSYITTLAQIIDQFVSTVMYSFVYFTRMIIDTNLFVVEEVVASKKNGVCKVKKNKIPLFHLIDIKTLRNQYIKQESNGRTLKMGHERRRHTRTFRSDYYTHRKGETIIIEPTWIGPTESFDPDRHRLYKVRLDVG